MWIDSHCHLNHEQLLPLGGAAYAVQEARSHDVSGMLSISCRIADEFDDILKIARSYKDVWCTIGTHPHDAGLVSEKTVSLSDLVLRAQSDLKIVGIGESGLDYYYMNSSIEDQQDSFRKHIRACLETGLPLVVHARDADEDIIRLLREEGAGSSDLTGVMHCFSSGENLALQALDLGFYISFSGILTFKKSEELRRIAKKVPTDRLLVETDAPFLSPEPYRGKVNRPAYVCHTGEVLAALHGMSPSKMAHQTTENFFRLFSKAKKKEV